MSQNYHEEQAKKRTLLLREKLKDLPLFVTEYFRGIENSTTPRTRLGYAQDLCVFFGFLSCESKTFGGVKGMVEFDVTDLDKVTANDLEEFMEYLTFYIKRKDKTDFEISNEERGKARKLCCIRAMYTYFYKRQKIKTNPTEYINAPKLHEKAKVYLDFNEVAQLLDEVESGEKLSNRAKAFHEYTKTRDLAILSLMLGTGIRITELVGLNVDHISCENGSFMVTRKGGNAAILYFGEEVQEALENYLEERERIVPLAGHEEALFLSIQRRRITDRAIQKLVKKYSKLVTTLKNITPHKLRTTFGTNLYKETGDIYLVADVLGHKDVNTTKQHYADVLGEQGRRAARAIRLRE